MKEYKKITRRIRHMSFCVFLKLDCGPRWKVWKAAFCPSLILKKSC